MTLQLNIYLYLQSQRIIGVLRRCTIQLLIFTLTLTFTTVHAKLSTTASSSWNARPFGHNRHGPKIWGAVPLLGSWVPISNNVAWAEAYLRTKWHLDSSSHLTTIDMGLKLGATVPPFFLGGGAGFPSNTKSPGLRPTCMPSFILIRLTVFYKQLPKNPDWFNLSGARLPRWSWK